MSPAPPTSRPQTLKQAKAAYKSRNQVSLTEKEKRQLDRAIELDRRAWRTKEADKRKAEAAKKKAENDRKQKEELERIRLGSQRRCDRFGYKSSQMHLGAFLNKRSAGSEDMKGNLQFLDGESEENSFDDDDLDDETLLDASNTVKGAGKQHIRPITAATATGHDEIGTKTHSTTSTHHPPSHITAPAMDDIEFFWEALDSSTQIARDLSSHTPKEKSVRFASAASSFSSGDFDLTIEDMEQLDPQPAAQLKAEDDRKLMPPPPLPPHNTEPATEFTMSQLERFVEDDLQLTQADPG
jgi:hypothetical protein